MRILSVRLINVKSYGDETITFQPGVNFISGVNGAGKTTVIESIGFALFDYLPYSARQFVREGAQSGEIQVVFEAKDERVYRVIRKFSRTARSVKWEVYDEETKAELSQLHGAADVSLWIKEHIGIDPSDDLGKVFSQVIAVEQGLFSAPFLETPAKRRDVFEDILKVEAYRRAFSQTLSLVRYIEGEINGLQAEIAGLEETVARLPQVEEELTLAKARLKDERETLARLQREFAGHRQAETRLAQLETALLARRGERERLQSTIAGQERMIASLAKQAEEAHRARQIVEANLPAFQTYKQASDRLQRVEREKAKQEQVQRRLQEVRTRQASLQATIETAEKDWIQSQTQLQQEIEAATKALRTADEKATALVEDAKQLDSWRQDLREAAVPFQQAVTLIDTWERSAFEVSRVLSDAVNRLRQLETRRTQLLEIVKGQGALETAEKELQLEEVLSEKAAVIAIRQALLQNAAHLRQGICPIVQDTCPSKKVAGDLNQFLSQQLAEFEQQIAEIEVRERREREKQDRWQRLREEIQGAQLGLTEIEGEHVRCHQALQAAAQTAAQFPVKTLRALLAAGQKVKGSAGDILSAAGSWMKERPWASEEVTCPQVGNTDVPRVLSGEAPSQEGEAIIHWLTQWMGQWEVTAAGVKAWAQGAVSDLEGVQAWFDQCLQTLSLQRKEVQTQAKTAQEQLRHCQVRQKSLATRRQEIENWRRQLQDSEAKAIELTQALQQWQDLDQQLAQLRSALQTTQAGYEAYSAHLQAAQKLEGITEELRQLQAEMEANQQHLKTLQGEIAQLEKEYDPKVHAEVKAQLQEVYGQASPLG